MSGGYAFGKYFIDSGKIFAESSLSYAFVNLKPLVPGHILISPKRVLKQYADLSKEEVVDVWHLAQKISNVLQQHHSADSLTISVQDGVNAGQTVDHFHIHILPRKSGDFGQQVEDGGEERLNLDIDRKPRTQEEMITEAAELRQFFQ
eukprot:TRINITY_DN4703_c0_g1_i2.p1 TRINITY_DN4703_c0_g1~~TRINITY_DN4703_c0_g1_i2.p1  ORF type:complete len:148 (-),score=28.64 TRINITY_DN4703_c0_g1_i2:115-558(-)